MDGSFSSTELLSVKNVTRNFNIWNKIKRFFLEPPAVETIEDPVKVKKMYTMWRIRIFTAMYLSYVMFYICRKNLSVANVDIGKEFHFTNMQLGIMVSANYLAYAVGKFVNGVFADRSNVRVFTPLALSLSGIANICVVLCSIFIAATQNTIFGVPSVTILLWAMAFFWGTSGWAQSGGFPPAAKTLTYWFSNKERGNKWSLWSSSHEIGSWLCTLISGTMLLHFGWRSAFYIPGAMAIVFSVLLYFNLRDKPTTLGLPEIEEYHGTKVKNDAIEQELEELEEDRMSQKEIFKKYILYNKTVWLLGLAYIFVYIVRFGTFDWLVKYLIEAKGNTKEMAVFKLGNMALFGSIGTISAGYISDKFFKGKRARYNIFSLSVLAVALFALKLFNGTVIDSVSIAFIGIFTCGPQVLIGGLCAVESSSKKVAASVTGFTGALGYFGSFLSGIVTGKIADVYGWEWAANCWIIAAIVCIMFCIPLWNSSSKLK